MKPETVEELRDLVGEDNMPQGHKELDWLMKYTRETLQKKGEDWLKKNLETFLRQWQYVSNLL